MVKLSYVRRWSVHLVLLLILGIEFITIVRQPRKHLDAIDVVELSSLSSEEVEEANLEHSLPDYVDKRYLSPSCYHNFERRKMQYGMLRWWMKVAQMHNITWFLTYGSLLGAYRHGDLIPWDDEIEVGVFAHDENLLKRLGEANLENGVDMSKINLVCRPGNWCPPTDKRHMGGVRRTCYGLLVADMRDECSVCNSLCRVVHQHNYHLDVYMYTTRVHLDKHSRMSLKFLDEGAMTEKFEEKRLVKYNILVPLQPCYFMNMTVLCPNEPEKYLKQLYKTLEPEISCFEDS